MIPDKGMLFILIHLSLSKEIVFKTARITWRSTVIHTRQRPQQYPMVQHCNGTLQPD